MKLITPLLFLLLSIQVQAQPIERGNITSCAYQAGTAYEIQHIRQQQGHNWEQFEANIRQIYKDSQGRDDLLVIAQRVFIHPAETPADTIHDEIFESCVARQQDTEPLT